MATYSIAIRTLGKSGEKFERELKSIIKQTIKPKQIIIYIAKGYKKPDFTIGIEKYVEVNKGMVAQRALDYNEIDSDYILMLDDDVELAPNSAELLLSAILEHNADCIAADTFKNHKMNISNKLYNIIVNFTLPHFKKGWAFLLQGNGASSYNNSPDDGFHLSQTAAGPAALWKKDTFVQMNYKDELWLDDLGFAYGDDLVFYNKLYKNNKKLGVLYNANILHLDGKSASSNYHSNPKKFYNRSIASFIIWHRIIYNISNTSIIKKILFLTMFIIKLLWLLPIHCIAMAIHRDFKIPYLYLKGIIDGLKYVKSSKYKQIPNFILSK